VGEDFCPHPRRHPRLVEREAGFTPAVTTHATPRAFFTRAFCLHPAVKPHDDRPHAPADGIPQARSPSLAPAFVAGRIRLGANPASATMTGVGKPPPVLVETSSNRAAQRCLYLPTVPGM
jgi:hypothetical protein